MLWERLNQNESGEVEERLSLRKWHLGADLSRRRKRRRRSKRTAGLWKVFWADL